MRACTSGRCTTRRTFLRATATSVGVAGVAGTATAQGSSATVEVGPGGDFVFTPGTDEPLSVKKGTKVTFEWKSDGHNIVVGSQPDGANWKGTEGPPSKLYDSGHTLTHTFDTKGKYHYWCQPHKSLGMVADIVVGESGSSSGGSGSSSGGGEGGAGGGGSAPPSVPASAKTLTIATLTGMGGSLGLGYFFTKFGGNYDFDEE